ncbi:MAG: PEP-CTERM sorting domain-containing protein [Terracidiphilus sp.]
MMNPPKPISTMRTAALVLAVLLAGAMTARADSLVTSRPAGTDSVDWSQLGADGVGVPNPFPFTTTDGVAGIGTYANPGNSYLYTGKVGGVKVQGTDWAGNFSDGDVLNWTQNSGPLTLTFPSETYTEIGAQIDADYYGAFVAQICDENGCQTETGDSNNASGGATFIGIDSSSPINWVTFSLESNSGGFPQDFAINEVTLDGGKAISPEPGSLLLLGTGLVGLAGALRRKLAR